MSTISYHLKILLVCNFRFVFNLLSSLEYRSLIIYIDHSSCVKYPVSFHTLYSDEYYDSDDEEEEEVDKDISKDKKVERDGDNKGEEEEEEAKKPSERTR